MSILITGGRGGLGRLLVPHLVEHSFRIGTRRPKQDEDVRFDLANPASIDAAVEGVATIIHLATDPFHGAVEREGSARLFASAAKSHVGHVVYLSIVGIDRHPYPYYRTKLYIERALEASGVPWTILRATQFHSLIPRFVNGFRRSPVMPVPNGVRLQPIDPVVVADRVVDLVSQGPSGPVPEVGGVEILELDEMIRAYLDSVGLKRWLVPVPLWGGAIDAFRRGDVLTEHVDPTGRTYREYLTEDR